MNLKQHVGYTTGYNKRNINNSLETTLVSFSYGEGRPCDAETLSSVTATSASAVLTRDQFTLGFYTNYIATAFAFLHKEIIINCPRVLI
jgi:hypothetical protein